MRDARIFFLVLSLAAGAARAQEAPTGIVRSGGLSLIRADAKDSGVTSNQEYFTGGFQSIDYSKLPLSGRPEVTTIGSCVVTLLPQPLPASNIDPSAFKLLDAGPVLNLRGPNGSKQFPQMQSTYGDTLGGGIAIPGLPPPLPPYLDAGTYTVDNGAGGVDIGPFTATLTVPSPLFTWTNADDKLSIDRPAGVETTWIGGDLDAKVLITGSSILFDSSFKVTGGGAFGCVADNSAGHFFVPPDVLALLPATVAIPFVPTSTLSVEQSIQTKFDAPGSDTNFFSFDSGGSRAVTYK